MPTIDPNNISYSQYEKVLVVVIEVVSSIDTEVQVEMTTPHSTVEITESNYFSNCIQITDGTYDDANNIAKKLEGTTKSFVSVTEQGCSKVTSLTLSAQVELTEDVPKTLCYIIEYNTDFIDYVNRYVFENTLLITEIDYVNDVTFSINKLNP